MAGSTPRGFRYLTDGDAPDIALASRQLAEDGNREVEKIYTEQLNAASPFSSAASFGKLVRRAADGRINVPLDPTSGENAASADYVNRLGLLSTRSAAGELLGTVAALTTVNQLTQTFTVRGNRYIKLTFDGQVTSNVSGTAVGIRIIINGAKYIDRTVVVSTANLGYALHNESRYALTAGTYTASVQIGRFNSSSGLAYITADECSLSVEDIGPR